MVPVYFYLIPHVSFVIFTFSINVRPGRRLRPIAKLVIVLSSSLLLFSCFSCSLYLHNSCSSWLFFSSPSSIGYGSLSFPLIFFCFSCSLDRSLVSIAKLVMVLSSSLFFSLISYCVSYSIWFCNSCSCRISSSHS